MRTVLVRVTVAALLLIAASACGGGGGASVADGEIEVVVTTSVLGDVVEQIVGPDARVVVLMPPGSDAHSFAPSPQQVQAMREADVLVANGLGMETALLDTIDSAERDGTVVVRASEGIDSSELRPHDPHFFTDPVLMRAAVKHIARQIRAELELADPSAYDERVDDYLGQLDRLDQDMGATLAAVPGSARKLVTNHDVLSYFADRYDFEVLGSIVPSGEALADPSASRLRELAQAIKAAGVPAIFVDTASSKRLSNTLAAEGTNVRVVALYSDALGPPGSDGATYIDMMRTNATRIAKAWR